MAIRAQVLLLIVFTFIWTKKYGKKSWLTYSWLGLHPWIAAPSLSYLFVCAYIYLCLRDAVASPSATVAARSCGEKLSCNKWDPLSLDTKAFCGSLCLLLLETRRTYIRLSNCAASEGVVGGAPPHQGSMLPSARSPAKQGTRRRRHEASKQYIDKLPFFFNVSHIIKARWMRRNTWRELRTFSWSVLIGILMLNVSQFRCSKRI